MEFDLELDRVAEEIGKSKAKKVCLQLPDGLKPKATEIIDELRRRTDAQVWVWLGSNFGACDFPFQLRELKFDLVVNFGHSQIK